VTQKKGNVHTKVQYKEHFNWPWGCFDCVCLEIANPNLKGFPLLTKFAIQEQIIVKYKEIATFMVASH
jgi:hypothetical protein